MVAKKEKPNFTGGPLFWRLLLFTLPIVATGLLQVVYNMADNIVIGRFSGDSQALAAVGQTSSFNGFVVNLFNGLSLGGAVVSAQLYGAKRYKELSRAVGTIMTLSYISAAFFFIVPFAMARPVLSLIVKPELLSKSLTYVHIICFGYPALTIYNFAAGIIRSTGDSKTPLVILSLSGLLNVALNLVFVIVFKMSVVGVALATVISQYAAMIAVLIILIRHKDENVRYNPRKLIFDVNQVKRVLICGVPASIQTSIFAFSNMIITSAISTFPVETISGNTIASNIDSVNYTCMNAFTAATMTVVAQNHGANKHKRVWRTLAYATVQVVAVGVIVGYTELLFARPIASLFVSPETVNRDMVISEALTVMRTILIPHFLSGIMNVFAGFLQGLGFAIGASIGAVSSVLSMRFAWIYIFFPMHKDSIAWLYLCYPLTWMLTIAVDAVMIVYMAKKIKRQNGASKERIDAEARVGNDAEADITA